MVASRRFVAALAVMLLAASCSSSDSDDDSPAASSSSTIIGWASAGGPLSGATVTIESDGKELGSGKSLSTGLFVVEVSSIPTTFTLEATGGEDLGKPFDDTIRAEIDEYVAHTTVDVNLATTLIVARRASDPDVALDEATTMVRRGLGLGIGNDLGSDLRAKDDQFNGRVFVEEASDAGGVDSLIAAVDEEIARGEQHRFAAPKSNQVLGELTLGNYLAEVALGAAKEGGSVAFGQVLSAIGLGSPDAGALSQIQSQLDTIQATLSETDGDLQALKTQAAFDTYVNAENALSISNEIDSAYQNFLAVLDTLPPGSKMPKEAPDASSPTGQALAAFRLYFLDKSQLVSRVKDLQDGLKAIYTVMHDNGGFAAWRDAIGDPRFVTSDMQRRLDVAFQYWTSEQIKLFHVNHEYQALVNNDPATKPADQVAMFPGTTATDYGTWDQGYLLAEHQAAGTFGLQPLPTTAGGQFESILDMATGLVWLRDRVATELGAPDTADATNSDAGKCIYEGMPVCQEADAQTALTALNNAKKTTSASTWTFRMPTNGELVGVVSASGSYAGWNTAPSGTDARKSPGDFLEYYQSCESASTTVDEDSAASAATASDLVDAPATCSFSLDIDSGDTIEDAVWDSQTAAGYCYGDGYSDFDTCAAGPGYYHGTYKTLLNIATSANNQICADSLCTEAVNSGVSTSLIIGVQGAILMVVAERPAGAGPFWSGDPGAS